MLSSSTHLGTYIAPPFFLAQSQTEDVHGLREHCGMNNLMFSQKNLGDPFNLNFAKG